MYYVKSKSIRIQPAKRFLIAVFNVSNCCQYANIQLVSKIMFVSSFSVFSAFDKSYYVLSTLFIMYYVKLKSIRIQPAKRFLIAVFNVSNCCQFTNIQSVSKWMFVSAFSVFSAAEKSYYVRNTLFFFIFFKLFPSIP
jgi:hypothetical protein